MIEVSPVAVAVVAALLICFPCLALAWVERQRRLMVENRGRYRTAAIRLQPELDPERRLEILEDGARDSALLDAQVERFVWMNPEARGRDPQELRQHVRELIRRAGAEG
jgi:hypothetical protein